MKLHKHVVTKNKVSFIEVQRIMQHEPTQRHPFMLTMPKEHWLELDRPETVEVDIK